MSVFLSSVLTLAVCFGQEISQTVPSQYKNTDGVLLDISRKSLITLSGNRPDSALAALGYDQSQAFAM